MQKHDKKTFRESVNWEWVHTYHKAEDGKVKSGTWLERIIDHARRNGFKGKITQAGALRVINANLY